jgi:iron complex outermembrane receptor protein
VQNGFRAPSLQQQFFATTSTNVLSENLTQDNVRAYLQSLGFIGVGGGRFFINGVDTETTGVDLVLNAPLVTDSAGRFDFTFTGNYNKTEVSRVPQTQQLAALNPSPPLFDRINVLTFEEGTPRTKFTIATNWTLAQFGATLRATRYGDVLDPGTTAALDADLGAKTVVDLEGRVTIADRFKVALGAENLFDEYPDAYEPSRNTTGNTPYSNYAPFGRSGRFLYVRASVTFD